MKKFLYSPKPDERFVFQKNGVALVPVFIEFINKESISSLAKSGLILRTVVGNIATADIPLNNIQTLASHPAITRIELPLLLRKTDTTMKRLTGVDKVQEGLAPLRTGFTGKNVLIGVIDDGIDITHPEFVDYLGNTRLNSVWNMDYAGTAPAGFSYGHLWDEGDINESLIQFRAHNLNKQTLVKRFGYGQHGTPVIGLAAGINGVAPGASVVAVALTAYADTVLRSDRLIDAIAFIYNQAKKVNKKCVINISLGVLDGGPHDGQTMLERAIDVFCAEKDDILVAVSAGNMGNSWKHWGGNPVHKDSSFGFFRSAYKASIYFVVPKQFSDSLKISIGESMLGNINNPNISRDSVFFQTPYLTIRDIINSDTPVVFKSTYRNLPSTTISFTASHYNSSYDELVITTDEHTSGSSGRPVFDDHLYRFIFKGVGIVHGWYPFLNLHPIYFFDKNPYPNDPTYVSSDNHFTTTIPSNAYSVITSGAYNIRDCYKRMINNEVVHAYPSCQLTYFTSHGPTLDGRTKPDVISPGENVIAPRSRTDNFMGHQFIIDSNWIAFSGTSAASPITAGVAALIWEAFPHYSRDSIIHRIKSNTYSDQYTNMGSALPNNISGWGKVDAFRALTGQISDFGAFCGTTSLCEVTVIPPPEQPNDGGPFAFSFSPNPANRQISIKYRSSLPVSISLLNLIGQRLWVFTLPPVNALSVVRVDMPVVADGLYFFQAKNKAEMITKQLVVIKR